MLLIGAWNTQHWMITASLWMSMSLFPFSYVSDAVTGVIIISILFFFPSQCPSLRWWVDSRGQWVVYWFSVLSAERLSLDYEIINFKLRKLSNQSILLIFIKEIMPLRHNRLILGLNFVNWDTVFCCEFLAGINIVATFSCLSNFPVAQFILPVKKVSRKRVSVVNVE